MSEENDTLLDIAKRNYETAELLYTYKQDDAAFLNFIGYHLQQAVELSIKHFMETHGIKYSKTHDIADLLQEIPEKYRDIFADIEDRADTITKMESKTRYVKNYRLSINVIKKIMPLAKQLMEKIARHEASEIL